MKKKFGIIGNPIKHSLSPVLHNYWFKKYEIDAHYSIIDIQEKELPTIIEKIKNNEIKGINITLPYKQRIVPHLDVLINDAEITSSVNTIYLDDNGKIIGENTDVFGLSSIFEEAGGAEQKNASNWCGGFASNPFSAKISLKEIFIAQNKRKMYFLKQKFKNLKIIDWTNSR